MRGFQTQRVNGNLKIQEINRILELVNLLTVKNLFKKTIVGISDLFRF